MRACGPSGTRSLTPASAVGSGATLTATSATSAAASLLGRIGAHTKWANTQDRTAATAPARAALEAKFLTEADGDPVRAASLRKAYFARLSLASAKARRARAQGGDAA
jgi:hypothetical protein